MYWKKILQILSSVKKTVAKHQLLVLAVILIAGFALRLFAASEIRIDGDEGNYLLDAKLLMDGKVPYKDFNARLPVLMHLLVPFIQFFGNNMLGGRLLSVISVTLTALFLFKIGKRLANPAIGLIAAGLYSFIPSTVFFLSVVKTEPVMLLFATITMYFIIASLQDNNAKYNFIAGIFLGLALLTRASAVALAIAIPSFFLATYKFEIIKSFKKCVWIAIGALIVIMPVITYLLASAGIQNYLLAAAGQPLDFSAYFHIAKMRALYNIINLNLFIIACAILFFAVILRKQITGFFSTKNKRAWLIAMIAVGLLSVPAAMYGVHSKENALVNAAEKALSQPSNPVTDNLIATHLYRAARLPGLIITIITLALLFVSSNKLSSKSTKSTNKFLMTWLFSIIAVFLVFVKLEEYYFTELLPPLSLMAAFGMCSIFTIKKAKYLKIVLLMFLVILAYTFVVNTSFFTAENGPPLYVVTSAAEYIAAHTNPDDEIFTASTSIIFLSGRKPVLDITHPEISRVSNKPSANDLILHLREKKTKYIVLDKRTERLYLNDKVFGNSVGDIIESQYKIEKEVKSWWWDVQIFGLKEE